MSSTAQGYRCDIMTLKDCFDKGMLKKISPDSDRSVSSLKLAKHYLQRAEGNLKLEFYDVVLLMAYTAMLQAARALLYRDGIKERSHGCVGTYLRDKYSDRLGAEIDSFDHYRENRHMIQYEGGEVEPEEAETALKDAKTFITKIERLL